MRSSLDTALKAHGITQGNGPSAPVPPTPDSLIAAEASSAHSLSVPSASSTLGTAVPIAIGHPIVFADPLRSQSIGPADSPTSSRASAPLDGPLHDLMPALSVSASASSPEDGFLARRSADPFAARPSPGPPVGRRIVSAPWGYLASPPRGSPLSRSVGPDGEEVPPWRRIALQHDNPFGSPASPPGQGGLFDPGRLTERQRRRRSSASFTSITNGAAAASGSFVGSYEDSLLSGRMSAAQSAPLPFVASIGVLGNSDAPRRLRCPKHLHVPFGAVFFREPSGQAPLSCPYVGVVNLDAHYQCLLVIPAPTTGFEAGNTIKLPRFPGFEVPSRGQIQLVLKNSLDTAFKPFLIPYDVSGLDRDGKGGRTFLRQKSYSVEPEGHGGKGKLRFAVHLQFCSPPRPLSRKGKKSSEVNEPRFYLHRAIRLVFASRGLDLSDKLRVVHEGPGDIRDHHDTNDSERFADYGGPGHEWETARRKAKERLQQLQHAPDCLHPQPPPPPPPILPRPLHTQYPTYPAVFSSDANIPLSPSSHIAAPLPFTPSSLISCDASTPSFPRPPEPLTFERIPSPIRPSSVGRQLSTQSALSASRPTSAAGRSGSGERERIGR